MLKLKSAMVGATALAAALMVSSAASAHLVYKFSFNGSGIASTGTFTAVTTSTPGVLHIETITGTFSDSNVGVSGAITGMYLPLSYTTPLTTPAIVAHTSGGLSYDDTFYPAGDSPNNCPDYPFYGGVFDVYGVAFNVEGGYVGAFWSDGVMPVLGQVYAAGLADATGILDNPNSGPDATGPVGEVGSLSVSSVPEPGSLSVMLGAGIAGIGLSFAARKRKRAQAAA